MCSSQHFGVRSQLNFAIPERYSVERIMLDLSVVHWHNIDQFMVLFILQVMASRHRWVSQHAVDLLHCKMGR
jgi:hypothetical protein